MSDFTQPTQFATRLAALLPRRARQRASSLGSWLSRYFRARVTVRVALPVLLVLAVLVYTRSIFTNYIFDEQEALLANPYVNGTKLKFWQVLERDFWGLPPTRSIGSYRPLPNLVWLLLWQLKHHPWYPHFFNVLIHGVNATLVAGLAQRWLNSRLAAWLCGGAFVLTAVVTEAVCGVVGIADVLSGLFILLTLWSLRLHIAWQFPCAAGFIFLGLLSKESTLTATPLVAWAALVTASIDHPGKPARLLRALLVLSGAISAVVAYTYLRRHFFPIAIPAELQNPLPDTEPFLKRYFHEFLRWFRQPRLPADPINNPLINADTAERISGALRVYFRGLLQVVFPWQLSGDYSFPQEPVPKRLLGIESVLGGLLMLLPPLLAVGALVRTWWLEVVERRLLASSGEFAPSAALRASALFALGLLWVPVTYFPHSNIPVILPTVRAERFWYLPALATSLLIGYALWRLFTYCTARGRRGWAIGICLAFFGFQAARARSHALDYRNDLEFWKATASAVPNSAKAHLNYGVMLGARGQLPARLVENGRAMELAPFWPMANVYYADTLCRLQRADEAWPHYKKGFELGPNEQSLIALALQCLWDKQALDARKDELTALAKDHKGTWLAYLANDIVKNGKANQGVDPKYRPRGYNGGPREK